MPKVTDKHKQARRRQIADAATRCFARDGLHGTSMQAIIRESGLSAGAIYSYFDGKDEIIEAIADERHARERQLVDSVLESDDPLTALEEFGRALIAALKQPSQRRERRVGVELWAEALHNPRLRRIVRRGIDGPRAALTAILASAQARGEIPPGIEPDALARAMVALFHGFVLQQAWDETADVDAYLDAIDALVRALIVPAGGGSGASRAAE